MKCLKNQFLILCLLTVSSAFGQQATVGLGGGDEFVGPFASWANVKTSYGAVGDGQTDDTSAIQSALNQLGASGHSSVLYFPSGTYKITAALYMGSRTGVSLIGADPSTTTIKWAGSNAEMLILNGVSYARFSRLTWDGSGLASAGVDHAWNGQSGLGGTYNEHSDENFINMGIGIRGGSAGFMESETAVLRCTFTNNTRAGVSLENPNALDWYIWDSTFTNNAIGVTNNLGTINPGGGFHVYGSNFQNSTTADIYIGPTSYFGIRQNYSANSKAFVLTAPIGGASASITIQKNTIISPVGIPIAVQNVGPVFLYDNVIQASSGQTAPMVQVVPAQTTSTADVVAIGNTYTVNNPYSVTGNLVNFSDQIVASNTINATPPTLPGALPNLGRTVFEVGSLNDTGIQSAIDSAVALNGQRPVVHMPAGTYQIGSTVVIPVGSDLQLVGDGGGAAGPTQLGWTGSGTGPVVRLAGPSHATLREFNVNASSSANGIVVDNADQTGAILYSDQLSPDGLQQYGIWNNGLDNAIVSLRNAYLTTNAGVGLQVTGGANAVAGQTVTGRTNLYAGFSGGTGGSTYGVTNNGRLMAQDMWYEGAAPQLFNLTGSGTFTLQSASAAAQDPNHGGVQQSIPTLALTGFTGNVSLLGIQLLQNNSIGITGSASNLNVLSLGILGPINVTPFYTNGDSVAATALYNSKQATSNGSVQVPDQSTNVSSKQAFIQQMVAQTRSELATALPAATAGVTQTRFYRVSVSSGQTGVQMITTGQGSLTVAKVLSVSVSAITPTTARISWTTDQASDSQVQYGTTTSYGAFSSLDTTGLTSHSISLSGLLPGFTYHFVVRSRDASGYLATSVDNTFKTLPDNSVTAFVSNVSVGTPSSSFGGWVGMQFTVGPSVLSINSLGRIYVTGNSGTHVLKLVQASNGADVPGGSVQITMSAGPANQFEYAQLASTVFLQANTSYYLLSQETFGGDTWYNALNATISTTNAGTPRGSVTSSDSVNFTTQTSSPNNVAGPLNFTYALPSGDTSSPTIAISNPTAGAAVSGTVNVTAAANDNVAVIGVQFKVDGNTLSSPINNPPFTVALDTTKLTNGTHSITATAWDPAGNMGTATAVSFTVSNSVSASGTPLISTFSSTSIRNDFTGWVGMQFTVGSSALSVSSLGRIDVSGNAGTHTVKLVQASNTTDVPGGSVSVSMIGGIAGQFQYATLAAPVTLQANTTYFLTSSETLGGDQWYNHGPTTSTSAAVVNGAEFLSPTDSVWNFENIPGTAYVPVNLIYQAQSSSGPSVNVTSPAGGSVVSGSISVSANASSSVGIASVSFQVDGTSFGTLDTVAPYAATLNTTTLSNGAHTLTAIAKDTNNVTTTSVGVSITVSNSGTGGPTPFITSYTISNARNNFAGYVGMYFTVGPTALTVSSLGRVFLTGNTQTHIVKLVDSSGNDVPGASVSISMAGGTAGQFKYAALASSVTLSPNASYYLASQEFNGGDTWYDYAGGTVTGTSVASVKGPAYTPVSGGWVFSNVANTGYVPVNFLYVPVSGAAPPTISITSPTTGATVSGNISITAAASDPLGIVGVQFAIDGFNVGSQVTSAPYTTTLNTGSYTSSSHTLTATAQNSAGVTASSSVTVTFNNTAPVVSVTSPTANGVVSGTINLSATATASASIASVQFLVDGANVGAPDTVAPYTAALDTTILSNSSHTITAVATDSLGNVGASAGVAFVVSNATPPPSGTSFVTSSSLNSARNDFTGSVGFQFTVGSTAVTVTGLGRVYVPGNTGTHVVKLVNANTKVDVPGASVSISMVGGISGQIKYSALPSAVVLPAFASYYLVSQETSGGDQWYNFDNISTTNAASVTGPSYLQSGQWTTISLPSEAYVPVSFLYNIGTPPSVSITAPVSGSTVSGTITLTATASSSTSTITSVQFKVDGANAGNAVTASPYSTSLDTTALANGTRTVTAIATDAVGNTSTSNPISITVNNSGGGSGGTPFISAVSVGAARNNFPGTYVGMNFTVGASPLTVNSLGRIYISGNAATHIVKLVTASTGVDVPGGSVSINMSTGIAGQFKYASLASPVVLAANTSYYIASQETNGGDQWYDFGPVTATNVASIPGPVYFQDGNWTIVTTKPNNAYVPVNFTYTLTAAGSPATITASAGTPQTAPAGTAFATALQATVQDANGIGVPSVTVTFTAPTAGARGTFTGGTSTATATTNASGVATAPTFTANATTGAYSVTASVSGVTNAATFSLTNTGGTASTITASAGTPQSAAIGTAFTTALQATVNDASGNGVSGVTVTFTAPATGARGTFTGGVSTTTATTNASGIATAPTFTAGTTTGAYTVTASVAGVTTPANFALTNSTGPASTITATAGTPQSAAVSTAFATALQATVKDASGNGVSGVTVTFTAPSTGASGTFAGAGVTSTGITNASGVATSAVFTANGITGTYSVTGSAPGVTTSTSFALTNTVGTASTITATAGTPQSAAISTAFATTLQATVKDAGGNPVSGVTVTFTAPSTGASGTFAGNGVTSTGTTNTSGVAVSAIFTANATTGAYTVSASTPGVTTPASFALTNTAGTASTVSATAGSGQSAAINTAFTTALQATVTDGSGNGVSGVVVTFTAPTTGARGTFTGAVSTATATTNASGIATAPTFTAGTVTGAYSVTASAPGNTTPATFLLTNTAGAASTVAATAGTPQSAAISTAFATALQATVKDASGNPISGVTVTFTAPSTGASGTFAGGGVTSTATTNASGVANAAVLTANTNTGAYSVTASVTGVTTAASFALTNTAGTASTITASAGTPQTAAISTAFATSLQATVKDAGGNGVSGVVVTFTAPATGASGTFTGATNTVTATTNTTGIATAPVFTANATTGAYSVTASAPGVATSASFALTNTAGTPSTVTATAGTPQSATISTVFAVALQATVKDGSGNPVSGVTVTFTAPTTGARGTFTGSVSTTTATTNASGIATAPTFTAGTTTGAYNVTASAPGATTPATFALTNTAGAASGITATAGTPQSAAISTAFATALQATVKDASGNVVSGVTVTFTAPSTGASGTFAGDGVTSTGTTNALGVATSAVFTANATIGAYTITANAPGVTTPASFSLTNTAGAASTIAATAGTPQSAAINAAFATALQATVKDAGGNGISGVTVTFTAPSTGARGTFTGAVSTTTATTNASGVATAPTFTAGMTTGGYSVTASAPGVTTSASFALTNTAGAASTITATAGTPQSTAISTAFAASLQATVKDAGGNALSGVTVTFTAPSTGASGTFAGSGVTSVVTTNASGIATAAVFTANATAGAYSVTASVAGVTTPASFALTNTSTGGGGGSTPLVTASNPGAARNNFGGFVGMQFTVGASPITVNSLGRMFLTGNTGSHVVKLVVASTQVDVPGSSVTVSMTGGTAGQFVYGTLASPVTLAANTAYHLVSQETSGGDTWFDYGPVTTTSVVTVTGPSYQQPGQSFNLVNLPGQAWVPVNLTYATAAGGTPTSITAAAGTPQTTTVSTAFAATLQATVKDTNGNGVSGVTVTFTAPSTGASGTFAGGSATATATTNASGVATSTVFTANATAGSYSVTASTGGVASAASFALTNSSSGGGTPATITATTGTPQSATVSTAFGTALQATVTDSGGNGVSGVTVTFTAPSTGASGTFTGGAVTTTATTNASGVATAPTFTANATAGAYSVTASATGVTTSATFSLTNTAAGGGGSSPLITAFNPGAARSGFSGFIGMRITVGSSPITVNALGRIFVTGNTGSHFLKLVVASTGADVPGSSVTVSMAGGTAGQFKYGSLTSTVTLAANTAYYLVSQETSSGDQWFDIGSVTVASVATVNSAVYQNQGETTFNAVGSAGQAYVPVNLTYVTAAAGAPASITATAGTPQSATVGTAFATALQSTVRDANGIGVSGVTVTFTAPSTGASGVFGGNATAIAVTNSSGVATAATFTANATTGSYTVTASVSGVSTPASFSLTNNQSGGGTTSPFITAASFGAARNNFDNYVGMAFTVGSSPITLTSLGRIFITGNTRTHTVKLVTASTGVDVPGGSVTVATAGGTSNQYVYATLTSPITLQANTAYYLVSLEASGGDLWYDFTTLTSFASVATVQGPVYLQGTQWIVVSTLPGQSYVPVNFQWR